MDLDCTASQNINMGVSFRYSFSPNRSSIETTTIGKTLSTVFCLVITQRNSCLLGEDKFHNKGSCKDHPKVNCDFSETFLLVIVLTLVQRYT